MVVDVFKMARTTLGYLWNAPLGVHGALPSRAGHDARRMVTGRVRLCTRDARACAFPDTRTSIRAVARPFVHTGRTRVCKVGHGIGQIAPFLSVCAHAALWRVHSRTRDWQNSAVLVRMCTPSNAPCAQSDTTTGGGPDASERARGRRPTGRRGRPYNFFKLIRAARAAVSLHG